MNNTLDNKEKFFALYWGQKVYKDGNILASDNNTQLVCIENMFPIHHAWLELKPLSSITDEDLSKCYHLHCEAISYDYTQDYSTPLQEAKLALKKEGCRFYRFATIHDYLRSKGYALPYMGLSVEKLVEYGWVKLKEQSNGTK